MAGSSQVQFRAWAGFGVQNEARLQLCSTVRKCSMPTDHLCGDMSFSRTNNSPDLISYIYRIASVTLETLYCRSAARNFVREGPVTDVVRFQTLAILRKDHFDVTGQFLVNYNRI